MLRHRLTQGIAGAALSLFGLTGLAAVASGPAVAEEERPRDRVPAAPDDMTEQMNQMTARCMRMMEAMQDMTGMMDHMGAMDGQGPSGMMSGQGMSNMMQAPDQGMMRHGR